MRRSGSSTRVVLTVMGVVIGLATARAEVSRDDRGPGEIMPATSPALGRAGAVRVPEEVRRAVASVRQGANQIGQGVTAEAAEVTRSLDTLGRDLRREVSLEGAGRWSEARLREGVRASAEGLRWLARETKGAADDVSRFFRSVGDGIGDAGRRVTGGR